MNLQKILNFICQQKHTAMQMHRTLVSLQAVNPEHGGLGEENKARWIEEWLFNNGLCHVQRFDSLDERVPLKLRPNLVAHYNPSKNSKTLWIVCNMDTPAAGELSLWKSDPFTLKIDGDFLYGRGVEDNNQGIVSMLMLFDAFKATKIKPPIGLGVICVSAGITDHTKGISYVLKKNPKLFSAEDFIIVPNHGNADGSYIQLSEMKSAWVKVKIEGQEDHAGYEINSNSFEAGALFISKIKVKFQSLTNKTTLTITPTHCETTCTGINHIPSYFTFYLDIRFNSEYSLKKIMNKLIFISDKIEKKERVKIKFDFIEITPDTPDTSENNPVVFALKRAIKEILNVKPVCVNTGSITLVSILRSTLLPVVVWSIQSSPKIRANEKLNIYGQINQTKVLAQLLFSSTSQETYKSNKNNRSNKISQAESKVIELIKDGIKNDDIALRLGLSKNTIRTHIKSLYKKTECKNRNELKAWGQQNNE